MPGTLRRLRATLTVVNTNRSMMRALLGGALAVMLVACSSDTTRLIGYVPPTTKSVSSVTVTEIVDGEPRPFVFRADPGGLMVVNFGFTNCPDICPATLSNLKNAKSRLGDDATRVDIAMVTVDPGRDTTDVLPRYLSSFTDRFHAIVPASDAELRAAEEVFQASSSVTDVDGRIEVSHTGTAYVVDETGEVLVEWPFGIDTPSMASDLATLLTRKERQP